MDWPETHTQNGRSSKSFCWVMQSKPHRNSSIVSIQIPKWLQCKSFFSKFDLKNLYNSTRNILKSPHFLLIIGMFCWASQNNWRLYNNNGDNSMNNWRLYNKWGPLHVFCHVLTCPAWPSLESIPNVPSGPADKCPGTDHLVSIESYPYLAMAPSKVNILQQNHCKHFSLYGSHWLV